MTSHTLDDLFQANQRELTEIIASAVEATEDEGTNHGRAIAIIKYLKAHFAASPPSAHLLFQLYPNPPVRVLPSLSANKRKEREIRPGA